jgi:hypothetical protein
VVQPGGKAIFNVKLIAMHARWLTHVDLLLWLGLAVTIALAFIDLLAR